MWEYVNRFTSFTDYKHRVFGKYQGQVYSLPMNLGLINQFFGRSHTDEARALIAEQASEIATADATNLEEKAIIPHRASSLRGLHQGLHRQAVADRPHQAERRDIITRLPVRYTFDNRCSTTHEGLPVDGYTAWLERMADHPNIEVVLDDTDYRDLAESFRGPRARGLHRPVDEYFDHAEGRLSWRTVDLEASLQDVDDFQGTGVVN